MKWVRCLGRGHVPTRNMLSSSRIYCRRCGIELQLEPPAAVAKTEDVVTTVRRGMGSQFR